MKYLRKFQDIQSVNEFQESAELPDTYIGYAEQENEIKFTYDYPFYYKIIRTDDSVEIGEQATFPRNSTNIETVKEIYIGNSSFFNIMNYPNLEKVVFGKNSKANNITITNCPKLEKIDLSRVNKIIIKAPYNKDILIDIQNLPNLKEFKFPYYWTMSTGQPSKKLFNNCPNLTKIVFPEGFHKEANAHFSNYPLRTATATTIEFEGNVLNTSATSSYPTDTFKYECSIPMQLCAGTQNLTNFVFPKNTVGIGVNAFLDSNLSQITFPNTLKYIDAKIGCFENIDIPASVERISLNPFSIGTSNVHGKKTETITVNVNNPYYVSISNNIVEKATGKMIKGCTNTDLTATKPNYTITQLADYCLAGAEFESVTIPATIKQIDNGAFNQCPNLKTVTFESDVPPLFIGDVFKDCTNLRALYVSANAYNSYGSVTNLENYKNLISARNKITVTLTDDSQVTVEKATKEKVSDLYNSNLKKIEVRMPTIIEDEACLNCTTLQTADCGHSHYIGKNAFKGCTGLTWFTLDYISVVDNISIVIDDGALSNCGSITLKLKCDPPTLGNNVFEGTTLTHIYVPSDKVDAYKSNSTWSEYKNIIEAQNN